MNPIRVPTLPRAPRIMQNELKNNARQRRATPIFNPHGSGGPATAPPFLQNEPNLPSSQLLSATIFTKRTQFTPPPPSATPIMQNEPNFTRGGPVEPQKMRNEPNFTRSGPVEDTKNTKRTQSKNTNYLLRTIYAKRTQFITLPPFPGTKNAKRTQSKQINRKPLRHKHLG